MGYTKCKISSINFSFLLAAFNFAGWALFCAWYGWPRGFRGGSIAGFGIFAAAALFFMAFPILGARFPDQHPGNHELARYGDVREISERLDIEMSRQVEVLGPFRFTATFLVYDSGHEFQRVPYDPIVAAHVDIGNSDDAPPVVVRTRKGRQYQWYRTWLQGIFDTSEDAGEDSRGGSPGRGSTARSLNRAITSREKSSRKLRAEAVSPATCPPLPG
ncbi:MAG TPA: hypothetical protein VFE61_30075 [Candidatus Sulfotelmatobacter sp.]|nr:hypothetical protein [Candidatus Sulfotelmatobacter sp.]